MTVGRGDDGANFFRCRNVHAHLEIALLATSALLAATAKITNRIAG